MKKRRDIQHKNFRKIVDSLNQTGTESDVTREEERLPRLPQTIKKKNEGAVKGAQLRSLSVFDPVTLDEKVDYQKLPKVNGKNEQYEKKLHQEMRTFMKAFDRASKSPMKVERNGKTDLRARPIYRQPRRSDQVKIIVPSKNNAEPQRRLIIK